MTHSLNLSRFPSSCLISCKLTTICNIFWKIYDTINTKGAKVIRGLSKLGLWHKRSDFLEIRCKLAKVEYHLHHKYLLEALLNMKMLIDQYQIWKMSWVFIYSRYARKQFEFVPRNVYHSYIDDECKSREFQEIAKQFANNAFSFRINTRWAQLHTLTEIHFLKNRYFAFNETLL